MKEEISVYFCMAFRGGGRADDLRGEALPTFVCKRLAVPGQVPGRSGASSGPKTMPGGSILAHWIALFTGHQEASSAGLRFLSQTDGPHSSAIH